MKPTSRIQDDRLNRISGCELEFPNRCGIPARVFANKEIPLERAAVDELESVLQIQETIDLLRNQAPQFFGSGDEPEVTEVVLTPDFHKGAGIPIGTVLATRGFAVPQAIGKDINCGMRLIATDFDVDLVKSKSRGLESALRHIFFEGGRDIPMTPRQREALVRQGLPGPLSTAQEAQEKGIWGSLDIREEQENPRHMRGGGGYMTDSVFALQGYISAATGLSRDSIIGNRGGGNHFAEIQFVRRVFNGQAAHAWGLREGQVVVMIHAGSLGLGHVTGTFVHRKGATPAGGWEEMQDTHFAHFGEPVIVPGSMGASSFLLLGNGARPAICSACHGAGRALSRGVAMREDDSRIDEFLKDFTVITALDPNRPDVRLRPDILEKWKQELKKAAPYAYKEITPVIKTLQEAKIATPVVELFPLMTVKQ